MSSRLPTYQSQARIKTLFENRVCWVEDEAGEEELVASFVDLDVASKVRSA